MLTLAVIFAAIPAVSMAEESICRKKLLKVCDDDQSGFVCKLLSYDEPETLESISNFLNAIKAVDSEIQKDLICARLIGKKEIVNLNTELDESSGSSDKKYTFRSGIGILKFAIDNPDYAELIKAHQKLRKFKVCTSEDVEFNIRGIVADADAEYSGSTLKSFTILLNDVKFSKIKTSYAEGGFDVQRKPLEKKIDQEYQRLFNAGNKTEKKSSATDVWNCGIRKTPITASNNDFKSKFRLDENRRPLEYVKNEFKDKGNGTITDQATGLMWQRSGSDKDLTYENAKAYIGELNRNKFAGYSDWRLPTVDELKSLLTSEKQSNDLYINPIFDKNQSWCWTSDTCSSGGAWYVGFGSGFVGWDDGSYGYVRAVRSRQ